MRVLVAGGGTGGHVVPSLAVIEALEKKDPGVEILYVGSKGGIENKIIPKIGIPFSAIETGKWRRYHKSTAINILNPKTLPPNLLDVAKAVKGVAQAIKIIKKFDPNSIFIKGGYVGLPVGIAAKILGYPFVIHESDAVPGLTNKILSKWAEYTLVSYPEETYEGIFEKGKLIYTGTPVREDLLSGDMSRGFKTFKLDENIPTVLVIGGSQGSRALNNTVLSALEDLLYKYQIIHITGELDYDKIEYRASKLPHDLKDKYRVRNFLSADLKDAYSVSSLVVSRAGNNVLAELAALGKPSILVPLPSSVKEHQHENALIYTRNGAAYLLEEANLNPRSLKRQIDYLFEHREELSHMSARAKDLYKKGASELIVEKLLEIKIHKKKEKEVEKHGVLSGKKKRKE